VLEGLRVEESVAELCRRESIAANLYCHWIKDCLEAGKKQFAGDTVREATSDEVKDLRSGNRELKKMELTRLVEGTDPPARQTLRQRSVPRSTFYGWHQRYEDQEFDGLHDKKPAARGRWIAIP